VIIIEERIKLQLGKAILIYLARLRELESDTAHDHALVPINTEDYTK
jgi:hypothetical protein